MIYLEKGEVDLAEEKNFENKIKEWLKLQGIYPLGYPKQKMQEESCGYYEKRWGGGKFTKSGLPDMHIVVCGMSIEAELKATHGKPSELQKVIINQINESGGIARIVYPKDFEGFKNLILSIKGEKKHVNIV